ncbi:MarR family winged helix-turn-helix transcriptional regulator [uncultured Schumannella sp.]|uniref:MarR family winged helix-turn-helix transcriptional regulator n=1 Tax=uncultured Schumannella sp. TaxID=1195956 RepID=UPI0025F47C12|nr:MarR family transcriptional regulator [uncultured Schumannella sp.]
MPSTRPRVRDAAPRAGVRDATTHMREILEVSADFESHVGKKLEVNHTDMQAMEHLVMHGRLSPTELARRLGISTAAVTTVVDRLVAVGHATREPHPTDRRGVVVVPNPASVDRAMAAIMPMILGIDRVLDEFEPDDQETITRYLARVLEVYRAQFD